MSRRSRRQSRGQRGYSLIFLVMIFTCMSILVAAALPAIEQVIKRNREEELIFRGFQYAEAIRVFQRRFGRYPIRLEELTEVKPRCIRQLWKDPVSGDGKWAIVTVNGNRGPGGVRQNGAGGPGTKPSDLSPDEQAATRVDPGDATEPPQNLPILGVVSRSNKEAVKTLFGRTHYNEWRFTADVLRSPGGVGPGGVSRMANATWIGRPFRSGLVQPGGGMPVLAPTGGKGPAKTPPNTFDPRSLAPPPVPPPGP